MIPRFVLLLCALSLGACSGDSSATAQADLRIVSYNIRHGRGMDDTVNLERTAEVIESLGPDIVGLQEVDSVVARSGSVDQARELGRLTGLGSAFGAFMPLQGGSYGMAILSRHPIVRHHAISLPDGNEPRIALVVEIALPSGDTISAVNVHFDWVRDDAFRFAQASTLRAVLDTMTHPFVLIGDFNDLPSSRTLNLFAADYLAAAKPESANLTFPSGVPDREIDFIFAAPSSAWTVVETHVIDERDASDHRPVLAVFRRK